MPGIDSFKVDVVGNVVPKVLCRLSDRTHKVKWNGIEIKQEID